MAWSGRKLRDSLRGQRLRRGYWVGLMVVLLLLGLGMESRRSSVAILPDPQPLHGSQPYATLLCKFSDWSATAGDASQPVSYYDRLMLSGPNSVDHYWRQVSYGAINLAGSKAYGWFHLRKPSSAYRRAGTGKADLDSLASDCAAAAIAQAGKGLRLRDYVGLNLVFSECTDRPRGGAKGLWVDGKFRNYRVTWLCPGYASSHQIFAHEIGHSFGLPHSEDFHGSEYGNSWDLMSNAATCAPTTDFGILAQQPIAYGKDLLGWIAPRDKFVARRSDVATIQLDYLAKKHASSAGFLLAEVPLSGGRFYTVEARDRSGYDRALPAPGVLIHEVDPKRPNQARLVEGPAMVGKDAVLGAAGGWPIGSVFTDVKNNVGISVDQQVHGGVVVTLYTGSLPWPITPTQQQADAADTTAMQWRPTGANKRYEIHVTRVQESTPATPAAAFWSGGAVPVRTETGVETGGAGDWGATFVSDGPSLDAPLAAGQYRWQVRELPHGAWSPQQQVTAGQAPVWRPAEELAQLTSPLRVTPMVGTRSNGDVEVAWATEGRPRSVSVTRVARRGDAWAIEDLFDVSSSSRRGLALSFTPAGDLKLAWPTAAINGARALSSPAVALDSGGRAHTIWAGVSRGTSGIFAAIVDAHAPSAGPAATRPSSVDPVPVASDKQGAAKYSPALALDRNGNARAVWIDIRDGVSTVYSAEQHPDGTWGHNGRLSDARKAVSGRPRIAIDGAGNAYAVWESSEDCGGVAPLEEVTFAERPAGEEWRAPVTLTAPRAGSYLVDPVVAANRGGEVYVAWGELAQGTYRLYSTYKAAGGVWQPPRLAAQGPTDSPSMTLSLAVSDRGDAYLTWAETQGSQTAVRFAATH